MDNRDNLGTIIDYFGVPYTEFFTFARVYHYVIVLKFHGEPFHLYLVVIYGDCVLWQEKIAFCPVGSGLPTGLVFTMK